MIIAETIESQYVLKLTEARISRIAEARFLLNFPGQLNGCCSFVCHFFVFISGLLNDSILNFAVLFERTLFPAYVTTLTRDVTREQPLPSFHPILHLYLYLCCLTRADSFKVGVLCRGFHRGQTSKALFCLHFSCFASTVKTKGHMHKVIP